MYPQPEKFIVRAVYGAAGGVGTAAAEAVLTSAVEKRRRELMAPDKAPRRVNIFPP
jgi:hypothetical protein